MAIVDNAANVPSALPQPDETGNQIVSPVAPAQNQTQAPPQAPTQQPAQPSVVTPPVAPSPNQRLHSFVSSVLSGITTSLAGKAPVKYSVDATTGKMGPDPNQPEDTRGNQARRILGNALTGLGAGAQAGGQKSGLANALAGLGAGAGAQTASSQAADKQAKQQANEDFDRQQQKILRMHDIARGNMLMVSTMQHVYQEELDHDPVRKLNQEWASAAEDEDIPVHYMTESEAAALYKKSPQQLLAEHIVMPLGKKVVKDQNGEPVIDAATGLPKFEGQLVAIDGLHEGQFDKVPQSFVDAVKKYAPYSGQGITGLDGLTAEHPMSVQDFTKFHTAIQEGRKAELAGWAEKTPGANAVQDPNDPKGVLQYNPLTQETRPYKGGKPLGAAKTQADIDEKEANANKRDNSGQVTPRDKFIQDREDARAKMKKDADSGPTSNLTGDDYLATLPTGRAATVRAVAEGRQTVPANRKEALSILNDVHQAYGDWDEALGKKWAGTRNEYMGSGKTATQVVPAYNTALEHMQDLYNSTTADGIFNPGSKAYQDRQVALGYVSREVGKAVSAGAMTQKESEELLDTLSGGLTPGLKRERITKTAQLLHDKIDEYQTKFNQSAPSSAVKVPLLISPRAAASYDYLVSGGKTQPTQGFTVTDPRGVTHSFPDQGSADNFKKLAGIN